MSHYSETLMEHVLAPRNGGGMDHPDLTGHAGTPGRGAFLILFLMLEDDRIVAAKYHTYGCGPTIAAGSMLTELITGRTIAECRGLTIDDLIAALDGVPPEKLHCPALAIAALHDALGRWGPPIPGDGRWPEELTTDDSGRLLPKRGDSWHRGAVRGSGTVSGDALSGRGAG